MRTDMLLDKVMGLLDAEYDYTKKSRTYYKEHGHGVYFYEGRRLSDEEKAIKWAMQSHEEAKAIVWALQDVLDIDGDRTGRMYAAARALRRWYNDTEWMRNPSEELQNKLKRFIYEEA